MVLHEGGIGLKVTLLHAVFDSVNPQHGHCLAVAAVPLVALSALELEVDRLRRLRDLLHGHVDACFQDIWSSNCGVVLGSDHQHVVEAELLTNFKVHFLNHKPIIQHHLVLTVHQAHDREDLFWVRGNRDSDVRVVHVQNLGLFLDRLSVFFA